jgi:predicted nucleotidyltransferase
MLVKNISFPTYLEDITDIENSNIDVFVELEDGYTYTVVVATAKNIESLMDKEEINYFEPGYPFIIVKKLTKDIIEETIKAYAENNDGYWLKLYHFAGKINKTVFNKLQAEHTEYLKELDELDNS